MGATSKTEYEKWRRGRKRWREQMKIKREEKSGTRVNTLIDYKLIVRREADTDEK